MGQFGVCAKRLFQTPGGVSGSVAVGNDNVTSTLAAVAADPLLKDGVSLFRLGANLFASLIVDVALVNATLCTAVNIMAVKLIDVNSPVIVDDDQIGWIFVHVKQAHG